MKLTLSLRGMIYASMLGAMTALGALLKLQLPGNPVPITFQTLFVFLSGALLGGPQAAMSQIVYLFLGFIGLPVFAGGNAGLGTLLGPTGGYLFGFVISAFVMGFLINLKKNTEIFWMIFAMVIGLAVIYSLGVLQLSLVANMSIPKAITLGVTPFILGDITKLFAAAIIASKVRDKIKR
jgi:biotin transport system substrate-specific component